MERVHQSWQVKRKYQWKCLHSYIRHDMTNQFPPSYKVTTKVAGLVPYLSEWSFNRNITAAKGCRLYQLAYELKGTGSAKQKLEENHAYHLGRDPQSTSLQTLSQGAKVKGGC